MSRSSNDPNDDNGNDNGNDDDGNHNGNDDGNDDDNDDDDNDYLISKYVTIESIDSKVDVIIKEFFTTKSQNIFTWPASYLLACYVAANGSLFNNKRIVEIGSGTGLPSIVAALFAQASQCILTERDNEPRVLKNLNDIITMNNVDTICRTMPLSWGPISDANKLKYLECDYIFAADVFYSTEDFNNIFLTVASIMTMNNNTIFLTTYQERSIKRTIKPYLDFYAMDAVIIPRSTFLHEAHSIGYCKVVNDTNTSTRLPSKRKVNDIDTDDTDIIRIQTYDNIYMIKIFLRK